MTKTYKYKFSFVMPVYNVENYLAETIESILAQTMDFEDNVELILVNDGSPDNSEDVCLRYQQQFPNNIKYIKQKNQGVSAARNRGVEEATGKYISFLDSDDVISSNTLEEVYRFFEQHAGVDVASIKMVFTDARTGNHMLNYKYSSTRVVDISKEYSSIQLSGGSAFVRTSAAKSYKFDSSLAVGEDAKYLTEIITRTGMYGVVHKPTYYYRRPFSSNSALGGAQTKKEWYLHNLDYFHSYVLGLASDKSRKYVQFLVMYDLQWRFKQQTQNILNESELLQYKKKLSELLQKIDDIIISEQKNLTAVYKFFILNFKHGKKYQPVVSQVYKDKLPAVHIEMIDIRNNQMTLEGFVNLSDTVGYEVDFMCNTKNYRAKKMSRPSRKIYFLGEEVYSGGGYVVTIDIRQQARVRAHIIINDQKCETSLVSHRFTGLNQSIGRAYCVKGGYIVLRRTNYLELEQYSRYQHLVREIKYGIALIQNMKIFSVAIRLAYFSCRLFVRKPIWVISDRTSAAGDNGEALFKYINSLALKDVKVYFTLFKSSPDYARMKKIGLVVSRNSLRYKMLFLLSENIISSHADNFVINAFGTKEHNLRDLYNFNYVFLQHGITKDDISGWLNKYNKNIKLFVAAAKPEYISLLDKSYGYSKNEIKLTGFPRFDYLNNHPKKKVILAPTWRKNLINVRSNDGVRGHNVTFKNSAYYKFYNGLMTDDRVLEALDRHDMTGELYLHPSFVSQVGDFNSSDLFSVRSAPYDYKTAFSEGSLLITDYSSVAFDFAYLKKPILYTQYDRDTFFEGHLYSEGYFSYEKNGFGPVVYSYEDAVRQVISMIEADCLMENKYTQRVQKFFGESDKDNSKRVYESIRMLSKEK